MPCAERQVYCMYSYQGVAVPGAARLDRSTATSVRHLHT